MQLLRFFVMLHIVRILEVIDVKHVRNFNAPFKHGCRRKKVNEADEIIVLDFHFVFPRRKKFFRLRNQVFQFDCFVDVTFVNYRERHEIFFDCCIDTLFNACVQRRSDNQGVVRLCGCYRVNFVKITHFELEFAFFKAFNPAMGILHFSCTPLMISLNCSNPSGYRMMPMLPD